MGLLDLIKEDETFEFISLKEAINLLAIKTKSTTFSVATYLLNKNVVSTLACYHRSTDYKLYVSSTPSYTGAGWIGENYAFQWLQYIAENEKYLKNFSVSITNKYNNGCVESFWKRADFFNLECIKSLDLFTTKEWDKLFKQQQYIWDSNYLNIVKDDVPNLLKEIDADDFINESIYFEDNESTYQEIKKYPLFFKNKTFSIHEATCLMSDYNPIATMWDYEEIDWLGNNPRYEEASNFIFSAVRTNLFEVFSNGEYFITSDNLKILLTESGHYIDGFNSKVCTNSSNKNLAQNTKLKDLVADLKLDVTNKHVTVNELNAEIKKLKTELLEKDTKIKELESSHTEDDTDLINLIFDETAIDRYAPDLAHSIKLWKCLYIDNKETKDKHSYRANHWILKNTPYQNESSIEVKRLREVTSPFDSWHIDRKNKFNK